MKILIGTVSLNTRPLTELYLQSLKKAIRFAEDAAPWLDIDCLVIDNGSNDSVVELNGKYGIPQFRWIRNEKNLGVAPAWNQIIKCGFDADANLKYDYVLVCNNDIYWSEESIANFAAADHRGNFGWISLMLNDYRGKDVPHLVENAELESIAWRNRPDADSVKTKEQLEAVLAKTYEKWGGVEAYAQLMVKNHGIKIVEAYPCAPAFALSRDCIKQVGLFDEYGAPIGLHEDIDYCERIRRHGGFKVGYASGAYVHHFSMMTRTRSEFRDMWVNKRDENYRTKWGHGAEELHLVPFEYPIKLDIGSGEHPREGANWYHMDMDTTFMDVEFFHDASKELPFKDNSVSEIFASNVLEHIFHKDVPSVVYEWTRVLTHGGKMEIRVPNMKWICQQYAAGRWKLSFVPGTELNAMHAIFGGDHDGMPHLHKAGFDETNLKDLMQTAGLINIRNTSDAESWELRLVGEKA